MKFKETWTTLKNKLKSYDVPKLLASRAFLVGGCVVLVAVAITVSVLVGNTVGNVPDGSESESGKLLGNSVLVGDLTDLPSEDTGDKDALNQPSDLLSLTVLNRENVREDAMEVLKQIADNPDALPDEKEEALDQISRIMKDMEAEANIEILALAKGIPQCVAVISGDQCSIVVDSAEITDAELSQLVEIVYEQSGITPSGTKVILNTVPKA